MLKDVRLLPNKPAFHLERCIILKSQAKVTWGFCLNNTNKCLVYMQPKNKYPFFKSLSIL